MKKFRVNFDLIFCRDCEVFPFTITAMDDDNKLQQQNQYKYISLIQKKKDVKIKRDKN